MVAVVWITNLIKVFFSIVGLFIANSVVFPRLREVLSGLSDRAAVVNGIVSLLIIFVYVMFINAVVTSLNAIGNKYISYVALVSPALELLNQLVKPVGFILLATVVALAFVDKKK
jgi:hypothetical protein